MRFVLLAGLSVAAVVGQSPEIRLTPAISGVRQPTDVQWPRDGTDRAFVVEQRGTIRIAKNGRLVEGAFLDISTKTRADSECGLLGLAFPPEFGRKQYFYVNYTDPPCRTSFVSRFRVTSNPDVADSASEQVILQQSQPYTNHNGGQIQFGPDGFLYIGFGDGGSGGDPQDNGQRKDTWLGKMLRIDTESDLTRYRVPPSNPFANDPSYRPEIWAVGLRNPWRYAFDRLTGDLWIADVGQNRAEEVNFQPAASRGGENYGWRLMEGLRCFNPNPCDQRGLVLPVHEYTRERRDVSVTGGYVYRGAASPSLNGTYIYGDYASGRIWGLRLEGDKFANRLLLESGLAISTFGEDVAGEVYVADHNGTIYRIAATETAQPSAAAVVNAASFVAGAVPGSIASLFGSNFATTGVRAASEFPLPTSMSGVSVLVNGAPAPLYAVAGIGNLNQVNVQVPWEVRGNTATVTVSRDGRASAPLIVPVLASQPGIFAVVNEAIVVRASDNSLVTPVRPLRSGEAVYLYATGLGEVDNPPPTGAPAPREPLARVRGSVALTIGGVNCAVSFAGLAPDLAGVYQINFTAASGIAPGNREIVLTSNGVSSRAVRVAVE